MYILLILLLRKKYEATVSIVFALAFQSSCTIVKTNWHDGVVRVAELGHDQPLLGRGLASEA